MLVLVEIDADTLGGAAPNDGFIDPTSIEYYRANTPYNGGVESPTLVAGSQIRVRDIPITLSGTTLNSLVSDINAKTKYHHVIASNNTGLELIMEPLYERYIPRLTDITEGVAELVGFDNPTIGVTPAYPSLVNTLAKVRANIRWNLLLTNMGLTGNINTELVSKTGGTISAAPTVIDFVVDIDDNYYNYDFSDEIVYAEDGIKYSVAKSLMMSKIMRSEFYDITDADPPNEKIYGQVVRNVEVGELTTSDSTALGAVTVSIVNV